ncbi:unnamed protein product [Colias eurytheme]|nr:unnamed protein product [Colias eurytheme]
MDNISALDSEPQAVAGPSKRRRSDSSSCSSSSSGASGKQRSRRHRRKKSRRSHHHDPRMDKLVEDMGELQNIVSNFINERGNFGTTGRDDVSIFSGVSGDLYNNQPKTEDVVSDCGILNPRGDFTFNIETKLKDPVLPNTPDNFLKMLVDVQQLGNTTWSDVRYSDTQKAYNTTPGFIDLETNDEVKRYDTLRHLAHSEKAFAAVTHCVLKQKETLQESIRCLLSWAKETEVNFVNLNLKIEELFHKGEFHKISSDILQLVCGHRAEALEMRREAVTSHVRDPLVKASLNRIPPSVTHIFEAERFTSTLERAGGVQKVFWPPKTEGYSQSRSDRFNSRPSRGLGMRKQAVPSRGTQNTFRESGVPTARNVGNNPPSRGGYNHAYFSSRGQSTNVQQPSRARNSFHSRGSRPDRAGYQGRTKAPKNTKSHQKRYRQ